jgi:hypothetical protein
LSVETGLPNHSRRLLQPPHRRWILLWLLIGVPFYLYANLFAFPFVPFLLEGDQTFFWVYALRMLHGERVYRDFFQFTPPGLDLFYAALFSIFGPSIWVMNLAVLLLGVALCWLCFLLARQLMERDLALIVSLLFVVLIFGARLDATHHWFSLLAAMAAVKVVMPARTSTRIAAAGALLGIASFFTQTVGVAGVLALLLTLAWEHSFDMKPWRTILRHQLLLLMAFILIWFALSAHFIANVGWKQFWYLQATYPRKYVVYGNQFLLPDLSGLLTLKALPDLVQRLSVYLLLIAIYPLVLWDCWHKRRKQPLQNTMQPLLLALMGLALLLAIITRSNWNRIYAVAMPALILLLWVISRSTTLRRHGPTVLWLLIICLAVRQTWSRQHRQHRIAVLPAGHAILSEPNYEEFSWLAQHTQPGDSFFQSSWLNFYPPLELRSPTYIDGLWPSEVTPPEYVALSVRQLEQKQVKYILWTHRWTDPPKNIPHPEQDHLGPFRAYLTSHYTRVHVFSTQDEVWQRN